jgi:hypothetical protein
MERHFPHRSIELMKEKKVRFQPMLSWLVLALAAIWLSGCSDGRPARVPISGQVLIDGQPLKYGSIRFVPADARASVAQLDTNGRFTLNCFEREDGAVLGTHRVAILAAEPLSRTKVLWHTPKKYAETSTSGLQQVIAETNDALVINLSWDGGKPFTETIDAD